jgi:hypothetical protein
VKKNKMKQLLSLLFIAHLSYASFAQDLSTKSFSELENMKTEAIANSNFEAAQRIHNEIEQRKAANISIADLEAKTDADIHAALAIEDYEKADHLQQRKIKINKLKQIDTEINAAVAIDDFDQAQRLQQQQAAIKGELTGTKAPQQQVASPTTYAAPAPTYTAPEPIITQAPPPKQTQTTFNPLFLLIPGASAKNKEPQKAGTSFFGVSNPNKKGQ